MQFSRLKPKRQLGQHFLKNQAAIKKIVAALELQPGETVIEVGAGRGELTGELLRHNINLIAVEKDKWLARQLASKFSIFNDQFSIKEGDVLKVLPQLTKTLNPKPYTLVGNIPYYLTGYLLRLIGELEHKPALIVFTLQKEVAERLAAQPPQMNKLAASVQFWAKPEIIDYLKPGDFSPPPKVRSAIIRLHPKPYTLNPIPYYQLVNIIFKQPRKTIFNNLRPARRSLGEGGGTGLEKRLAEIGLTGKERPQNLTIDQIKTLSQM